MIDRIEHIPVAQAAALPLAPAPAPLGISGDSTIAPAAKPADGIWAAITAPFRPIPEPNYMLALLQVEREMAQTLEKEGKDLEIDIKSDLKRLEHLNNEKIEMLKKEAEAYRSQAKWDSWKSLAEYAAYSTSIMLGAACFASGAGIAPALFLFSSGVIGMVNRMAADSGTWRWAATYLSANHEKQIHLAQSFENGMTAAALALSLAGVCTAYYTPLYEKMLEHGLKAALDGVALAGNGMQIGQRVGAAYHEQRRAEIQAFLKRSQERSLNLHTEISMNTAEIQKMFKLSEEIDKIIKIAIASRQHQLQQLQG